jgi:uncharacterized protein YegP (UPF0339 family)
MKVTFYKDSAGEWRWRIKDPSNGLIIAASTEGYKNRSDAEANISRLAHLFSIWLEGDPSELVEVIE